MSGASGKPGAIQTRVPRLRGTIGAFSSMTHLASPDILYPMNIQSSDRFQISKEVLSQEVSGETVLLDLQGECYFSLI